MIIEDRPTYEVGRSVASEADLSKEDLPIDGAPMQN